MERESNWRACAISFKGAVGLMQLMPMTAERLGVRDRCNIDQNISGGVRHLAWLIERFNGDFRLAMAAYYAGEDIVAKRGLGYRNPDVVAYVSRIRVSSSASCPYANRSFRRGHEEESTMKMYRIVLHLIVLTAGITLALSQTETAPRIINLDLNPHEVTTLHLRPGYITSVRLPESVSSVVLGDPVAFKAEHSEAEPELVFFKPAVSQATETNALITTETGREISLTLVSEKAGAAVDYLLEYERRRSFLVPAAQTSFLVADTRAVDPELAASLSNSRAESEPDKLLREQMKATPHWEGKDLRVSIGRSAQNGDAMIVAFSVFNASAKTIELLPPQIELDGNSKDKHKKAIKAEPVPIKTYRLTSRTLAPHTRADGVLVFERPSFKELREHLFLHTAQTDAVDRPVLATISFVPQEKGVSK